MQRQTDAVDDSDAQHQDSYPLAAGPVNESFDPADVPIDEALDLLANARRRVIVATLADEAVDELDRMELVDVVASAETDGTLTSGARRSAKTGLIQSHGPVLEDADVIEIDDRNTWTLTPRGADLATVLEAIEAVCGGDEA